MSIKRPAYHTSQDSAFAMPVRPISGGDDRVGAACDGEIAPEWSVELHGICADEATLVLLPEDGDDATGPSFMISRETYGLRLDQVHWDVVTEVGVFRVDERRARRTRRAPGILPRPRRAGFGDGALGWDFPKARLPQK